MTTYRPMEE